MHALAHGGWSPSSVKTVLIFGDGEAADRSLDGFSPQDTEHSSPIWFVQTEVEADTRLQLQPCGSNTPPRTGTKASQMRWAN